MACKPVERSCFQIWDKVWLLSETCQGSVALHGCLAKLIGWEHIWLHQLSSWDRHQSHEVDTQTQSESKIWKSYSSSRLIWDFYWFLPLLQPGCGPFIVLISFIFFFVKQSIALLFKLWVSVAASPGSWFNSQNSTLQRLRPTSSESDFNKLSRWFCMHIKLEKHWSRDLDLDPLASPLVPEHNFSANGQL